MNPKLLEFEKRIIGVLRNPTNDKLLFYPDKDAHKYYGGSVHSPVKGVHLWDGYVNRLHDELDLTPNETKTAWLYFYIMERYSHTHFASFLKAEFNKVYEGINIIPMSDDELYERMHNEKEYTKLVIQAYLYGKTRISIINYSRFRDTFESVISTPKFIYRLEGPLEEERKFHIDMAHMSCDISEIYTCHISRPDPWTGVDTIKQKTYGWNQFSKVPGFVIAFEDFIKDFKYARQVEFIKKKAELQDKGITSRLVLKKPIDGFAKVIEFV